MSRTHASKKPTRICNLCRGGRIQDMRSLVCRSCCHKVNPRSSTIVKMTILTSRLSSPKTSCNVKSTSLSRIANWRSSIADSKKSQKFQSLRWPKTWFRSKRVRMCAVCQRSSTQWWSRTPSSNVSSSRNYESLSKSQWIQSNSHTVARACRSSTLSQSLITTTSTWRLFSSSSTCLCQVASSTNCYLVSLVTLLKLISSKALSSWSKSTHVSF